MHFTILALVALVSTAVAAPALKSRQDPTSWTIRNFTRDCTNPDICTYAFDIDQGNDALQPCTVVNQGSPATTQSWYAVTCQQTSDWKASWGWDTANDFTVLTIVNEPNQVEAFFGYNDPNSSTAYPDNGPQPFQAVGS